MTRITNNPHISKVLYTQQGILKNFHQLCGLKRFNEGRKVTQLNLNNLLMLYELRHQPTTGVNAITLGNETIAVVSGTSIVPLILSDTYDVLNSIILNDKDIAVVTYMQNSESMFDYSADMSYVIPNYLASLPIKSLSGLGLDNIQLTYKRSLDYQECRNYLASTDIQVSPFLYQWLDDYFAKISLEISFPVLFSHLSDKVHGADGEQKLFLLVLTLASLGFIRITHKLSGGDTKQTRSSHMVALPDKLSLALFIANNFKKGEHLISVRSKYVAFSYDFSDMDEMDVKKETTDEFLFNILSNQISGGMMNSDKSEAKVTSVNLFNRLSLFSQIKLLPLDIFIDDFENETVHYNYSLVDTNYINSLKDLITAGIEIIDMSILSMLQIKKMSTTEIISKTNATSPEINRSLFGLILLGLIEISQGIELPARHNTDLDSYTNREALRKVVGRK